MTYYLLFSSFLPATNLRLLTSLMHYLLSFQTNEIIQFFHWALVIISPSNVFGAPGIYYIYSISTIILKHLPFMTTILLAGQLYNYWN